MSQEGENNELSISNRNGNEDKLNINSKSSREMLHKEEIEEDKPTKDNVEKTIERENDEKNKMKDNKKEEKKNEELESLDNEVKLPIIPYKVSDAYPQQLITALRKNEHCRPRSLLAPDFFDITRNIDDLEKDEEKKLKLEEQEHNSLEKNVVIKFI